MQRSDVEKLVMVLTGEASGLALIGTSSGGVKQPAKKLDKPNDRSSLRPEFDMMDLTAGAVSLFPSSVCNRAGSTLV
jgi:hypothetical protein